jgi:hypothetical protein
MAKGNFKAVIGALDDLDEFLADAAAINRTMIALFRRAH